MKTVGATMKFAFVATAITMLAACVPAPGEDASGYLQEDGYYISVHPEGSAAVRTGLNLMDPWWSIDCRPDRMTGRKECSIWAFYGHPKVYYSSNGSPRKVCIVGHDFPGRTGMIRVDKNAAVTTDVNGCVTSSRLISQMRTGSIIAVRYYEWPYDYPKDEAHTLSGFAKSMDVVQRLRNGTIPATSKN